MQRALLCTMANTNEHPEKYAWWINELNSLGDNNEIVDIRQLENLAINIYQESHCNKRIQIHAYNQN